MKRLLKTLLALTAALAIGLSARAWLFAPVRIAGNSMADTLLNGDIVLISRLTRAPGRGSVMECTFEGRPGTYVKRIVAMPGDTVQFEDNALILNGRPLSEPYVITETEDMSLTLGPDEYFMLGDNRAQSYDSRAEDMGCIGADRFLGRAVWILWPINRFGPVE